MPFDSQFEEALGAADKQVTSARNTLRGALGTIETFQTRLGNARDREQALALVAEFRAAHDGIDTKSSKMIMEPVNEVAKLLAQQNQGTFTFDVPQNT